MCFVGDLFRHLGQRSYSDVQLRAMAATESDAGPAGGAIMLTVSIADCDALAQHSLDEKSYDQITDVLLRRMKDTAKWGRALKALMVLDYCVRKGSPRFKSFCRTHEDRIRILEMLPYVLSDLLGVHTDPGVEARCAGKRLSSLLAEPSFGHVNNTLAPRRKRSPVYLQEKAPSYSYSGKSYQPSPPSDVVMSSMKELLEGKSTGDAVIFAARETRSPEAFIDVIHAILHTLVGAAREKSRQPGDASTILLLLQESIIGISSEVALYFERPIHNRSNILPMLRSLQDLSRSELFEGAEQALSVVDIQKRVFQTLRSSATVLRVMNEPKPREYTLFDFMDEASRSSLDSIPPPYASIN
ncbi:ENTH domain-containing protein 1 [Tulasnella sp. 330]|nr:ENTH domain-containing protein 1 [Tulasnella sp. 330]KAG8883254.1 ENTH domain-containing protein 1 [Tulasnella sp. 331]